MENKAAVIKRIKKINKALVDKGYTDKMILNFWRGLKKEINNKNKTTCKSKQHTMAKR